MFLATPLGVVVMALDPEQQALGSEATEQITAQALLHVPVPAPADSELAAAQHGKLDRTCLPPLLISQPDE